MGGIFGGSNSASKKLTFPPELDQRIRANPGDQEVLREAIAASGGQEKALIRYFMELAADEVGHSLSCARLLGATERRVLAVVHYRKYLQSHRQAEVVEELASLYEKLGKHDLAAATRRGG
ncbi:MAG: hypothetical protein KC910_31225 [Candidatus Eremiobacteraeota bacterium]|nr:hypothetical protein [Candidatus Eremiobacteraeota bacterium]